MAPMDWVGWLADVLPRPVARPFWLIGLDTTLAVRPFAERLADRGVVYYPNPSRQQADWGGTSLLGAGLVTGTEPAGSALGRAAQL
jgi:hypothetical protein